MSRAEDKKSVIYVLGTAHGATSILGRLLGTVEGATYAGEPAKAVEQGFSAGPDVRVRQAPSRMRGGNGRFCAEHVVLEVDRWKQELYPIDRILATVLAYPLLADTDIRCE